MSDKDDGATTRPDGIVGEVKRKLIDTKRKWAEQGRGLTGQTARAEAERLPPGQRLVTNFPVLDLGIQPAVATSDWELTIAGAVENPLTLRWADFQALPQVRLTSDIHCVTTWSRYDNAWDGVSAFALLDLVRPKPEVLHVLLHSYDGYTTNIDLAGFADDDVLLAHSWQGEPLTREHGGPVRLVIPKRYFWKSAKWIRRIEFSAADAPGFWEMRGYHNEADPFTEERYS
ncbi:molybdopterin-binding oxidoreductase [Tistrella bauzanensis]|uniref:Molybdopterin-binding oxidoreductase n=1 Tax=Tistrella bauzanensis TaxID=657419 RepID=A0ABQ1IHM5_9PROT|nr:sulfite oxidase-like oxidoreductase [Tistrella bauzanensis]GGB41894.1 molybdopterin-binding oxidoreductase [Tistrella bauzanensis]